MVQIPLTLIKNDDGSYTVLSNIFNIVTEGDTLDEAIANGQEALSCHIEGLSKDDDEYRVYESLGQSMNTSVAV
ncbi:type II toxin-antitoxin system HicB family antitoxin [Candidatus Gracilibacteria bacterium]|nr:type II toxin-antitoxin system HicB family antitoxin [Candidatus Gracilibacteria bacterium]